MPEGNPIFLSFKRAYKTVRKLPEIPITAVYLAAFFLFSDGYSTITSVAVLFASEELEMGTAEVWSPISLLNSPFTTTTRRNVKL